MRKPQHEVIDVDGYQVTVGRNLLNKLAPTLGETVKKVLIVNPQALRLTGEKIREELLKHGYEAIIAEIPDAESGKNIQVAAFCWEILGKSDFTRSDAIVTVGGGAVTDLGGFVAATWLRGIKVVHMPTTVLGIVDASVGGKTGINTVEGKNLVGSFHKPLAVLADLNSLETLPENEVISGMAEVVKCGFIADERILEIVEENNGKLPINSPEFFEVVTRAIKVKAEVVTEDFKETGRREYLNYGHTLGHAIEHAERYQFRHGAAVAIGMVFAAELGALLGKTSDEVVQRHREILEMVGLPTTYIASRWSSLYEVMKRDKKTRGDILRFVVLKDIGEPTIVEVPDASLLFASYQEIVR
ncbi:MAG: 3-dehydroquinate synthase [Micrococcaceae bacterium]